jgi:acyl dehydratase
LQTLTSAVASLAASAFGVEAASIEISSLKVAGPLVMPAADSTAAHQPDDGAWDLGALAGAHGTITAKIRDAHLLFDADVTVPVVLGRIDFNDARVEHVGPDSRMGVSRMGIFVDAPNGRSYLYQFPSAPVSGVEYEKRGGFPNPLASNRGSLQLQPFAQALLRQGPPAHGLGFTDQARLLFERTAVAGELRLGDGRFAVPGLKAEFAGRSEGRNTVRLDSEAVGRGFTAVISSLLVRNVALHAAGRTVSCAEVTGELTLRLTVSGEEVRFALEVARVKLNGVRVG